VEIEHHVHAVTVLAEIFHISFRQNVGFSKNDRVALAPLQKFAQGTKHVVLLNRRLDLCAFGGNHEGDGIHPETGHAELNPEPHDLEDLGLDVWVRRVEIGLKVIEAMKEPSPGFLVMRPCRFLHPGKDHALAGAGGSLVGPDVPIAMLRIRRASCVAKPRVGIRGVIDNEIDDDANASLLAAVSEFHEVAERAVSRIDAIIVGDVVTIILAWRRLKRHQPDRGHSQPVQIVETPQQPFEVADAVAIGIHIGANRKAIEHAVLVPKIVNHEGCTG